jgi:hypothetical protein
LQAGGARLVSDPLQDGLVFFQRLILIPAKKGFRD